MSTLIKSPTSDLAIGSGQSFWTEKQAAALRQLGVARASNADLAVFFHQVTRTGLDPFARQIYMIERAGKQTIQTGIDGFRLIARRAVDRSGESLGYADTLWCGKDGKWRDVWLDSEPPAAAKVTVLRNGQTYSAVALYAEYVALDRGGAPVLQWRIRPALMTAKCGEALALRKAFPQDLSGIYTSDELQTEEPSIDWTAEDVTAPTPDGVIQDDADGRTTAAVHAETVDGEVVEDRIKPGQVKRMAMLMGDQGMTDRGDALKYVALVIGHEVGSRNELTKAEASNVIDALERDVVAQ